VLLATSSFWQGVDVVGEALSCVIIDRLPFASPADPVVAARIEAVTARGADGFADFQVPLAILTLQQGLGRLIRHRSDRGVLAILDPRVRTMGYGQRFLASLPPAVAVVLDEAYGEFLDEALRAPSLDWLAEFPNLILTRTFSKAYGLAGLRVGYALAHPEVADLLNRVRQPFNVNSLALAGAAAALDDGEFIARSKAVNDAGMAQLVEGCKRLGLTHIPSHGNFVCIEVGADGAASAKVYQALLRKGVIVRPVAN